MDTIYVEREVREHPRTAAILKRYPRSTIIDCDVYTEVFNPHQQNFRLQKKRPSLILAKKHGRKVLPTPSSYSIGRKENFYFSHMLNCLYDCRYCFLQGMFRSANYVSFVNFEDFQIEINEAILEANGPVCFFSGYDCDSLVFESLTNFAAEFVPFFQQRPEVELELRTKSLNTSVLENFTPSPNIITAFTLSPGVISREVEIGAPPLEQRLNRVRSLTQQGWMVGLRLDPLLPWPKFEKVYGEFLDKILASLPSSSIHSVTLGSMRFPKSMYERIVKLYPHDPLFALEEMELQSGQMSYPREIEEQLSGFVEGRLNQHLPAEKIFRQT